MTGNIFTNIFSSIQLLFAGLWFVVRIILEYFGFISDGNDRTTGIKDIRMSTKKPTINNRQSGNPGTPSVSGHNRQVNFLARRNICTDRRLLTDDGIGNQNGRILPSHSSPLQTCTGNNPFSL